MGSEAILGNGEGVEVIFARIDAEALVLDEGDAKGAALFGGEDVGVGVRGRRGGGRDGLVLVEGVVDGARIKARRAVAVGRNHEVIDVLRGVGRFAVDAKLRLGEVDRAAGDDGVTHLFGALDEVVLDGAIGVDVIGEVADVFTVQRRELVGDRGDFDVGGLVGGNLVDEGVGEIAIDVIGRISAVIAVDLDGQRLLAGRIDGLIEAQENAEAPRLAVIFGVIADDGRGFVVDEGEEEPDVMDFAVPGFVVVEDGEAIIEDAVIGIGPIEHRIVDGVVVGIPGLPLLPPIDLAGVLDDVELFEVDEVAVFLPGVDVVGNVVHRAAVDAVAALRARFDLVIEGKARTRAAAIVFIHELAVARKHVDVAVGMELVVVDGAKDVGAIGVGEAAVDVGVDPAAGFVGVEIHAFFPSLPGLFATDIVFAFVVFGDHVLVVFQIGHAAVIDRVIVVGDDRDFIVVRQVAFAGLNARYARVGGDFGDAQIEIAAEVGRAFIKAQLLAGFRVIEAFDGDGVFGAAGRVDLERGHIVGAKVIDAFDGGAAAGAVGNGNGVARVAFGDDVDVDEARGIGLHGSGGQSDRVPAIGVDGRRGA